MTHASRPHRARHRRRPILQRTVRADVIVVTSPGIQYLLGVRHGYEHMGI